MRTRPQKNHNEARAERKESTPKEREDQRHIKGQQLGRQQIQVLLKLNALPIKKQKQKPTDLFTTTKWKTKIINQMSAGASLVEVLAELGISRAQHHKLMKLAQQPEQQFYLDAKEYAERVNRGLELSEAWWLRAGREGLSLGKAFGSSLFYMNMKNRFGWAEKVKSDYGEETLKTLQDTIAEIAKPTKGGRR